MMQEREEGGGEWSEHRVSVGCRSGVSVTVDLGKI